MRIFYLERALKKLQWNLNFFLRDRVVLGSIVKLFCKFFVTDYYSPIIVQLFPMNTVPKEFFTLYPNISPNNTEITPFGEWLINTSWELTDRENWTHYFVQKVNTKVFSRIDILENNLKAAQKALVNSKFSLVFPIENISWKMHTEINWEVYRVYPFVEGGETFQSPPSNEYIYSAAKSFAEFSRALSGAVWDFEETIPDFHNLSVYYKNFDTILWDSLYPERIQQAKKLIEDIKEYSWIVGVFENLKRYIPKRVFHHDTKVNNILFKKWSAEVLIPVDLDTIMPGYIFSDFGDMVWSMVLKIDHSAPEKKVYNEEAYNALVDGYIKGFDWELNEIEVFAMQFGGIVMSYMLTLRFLSDYLSGDTYFRTTYKWQNLDRALYQMDAVKELVDYIEKKFPDEMNAYKNL